VDRINEAQAPAHKIARQDESNGTCGQYYKKL
jgi:hypothetical protein